jgi:cystathionine beta-lyase family protein involved in aluminum resistance
MKQELHKIFIIPARFIKQTKDNKFDDNSLKGLINPKYLLIGIMTGVGYMQINFVDANDYEKMFNVKWKILVK